MSATAEPRRSPDCQIEIEVEPSLAIPGSIIRIHAVVLSDAAEARGVELVVDVVDSTGHRLDVVAIEAGAFALWTVPREAHGDVAFVLTWDGRTLDTAILEVASDAAIGVLQAMETALQHERDAYVAFRVSDYTAMLDAALQCAAAYDACGAPELASKACRQLALEMLRETDVGSGDKGPLARELALLSLEKAKASGDMNELIRSLHLVSSPDCSGSPEAVEAALCDADSLLRSTVANEYLWCDHYASAAVALERYPLLLRHGHGSWDVEPLRRIALSGVVFALLTTDSKVRDRCLHSLLPMYRRVGLVDAGSQVRALVFGVQSSEQSWTIKVGMAQEAAMWHTYSRFPDSDDRSMPRWLKVISQVLSPIVWSALLAGIKSLSGVASAIAGPSARLVVRVRITDRRETFELCNAEDDPRQQQVRTAAKLWLSSADGEYYRSAMNRLSCRLVLPMHIQEANESERRADGTLAEPVLLRLEAEGRASAT